MLSRRHFVALSLVLGLASGLPLAASVQAAYPSKPVHIVVPNAPGGAADLISRAVGQKISETLGQPVIIDNKPGAGGVVAGDTVAKASAAVHAVGSHGLLHCVRNDGRCLWKGT